jgi:hypothetical protein
MGTTIIAADKRQQRWREFLLGDDPHEDMVRHGALVVGDGAFRRRMQQSATQSARRRGRPRKPPHEQEGLVPEFYVETRNA